MRNLQMQDRPEHPEHRCPDPPGQQQSQQWYLTSPDTTVQQLVVDQLAHVYVPYLRRLQPALLRHS
jgi:hypothetical protein